jgi:hypothetical protein
MGEKNPDKVRKLYNEGGLYGEVRFYTCISAC